MSDFTTNEQLMAKAAYDAVEKRKEEADFKDYKSFALSFPALIHSCGLVQAVAFAKAKKKDGFIDDIQSVFNKIDDAGDLQKRSREADITEYMRITRHAISAASWIKRYCQATDREGGENFA
ncbi:MAG: type III-B CRISPR module-associated protein Cmr5 [Synergistaceae bacterium]|nr:type III-B CRISPR module-associated protein Cmr5 [Synergistaceae bacterium]MBQ6665269.1 type III-B CRISPR module-associated protein Cmr5 [Synergistaceae bacterium]